MKPGQHRETARIALVNQTGKTFLLLTEFDPEVGLPPRWLVPGGGIDHGESVAQAALRELREETGLQLQEHSIGTFLGAFEGIWHWADGRNHHTYIDHVFVHHLENFKLNSTNWTADEHRDILQYRWWNLDVLEASGEQVSPPGLLQALKHHLSE